MDSTADHVEAVVGNIKEFAGPLPLMKEVDVADYGKCLLIRHEDGEITALGHKCSHYGAPLVRGDISGGVIRCPWHGACFNARTGDIEDYPGIDSLPKHQVSVDNSNGQISVKANILQLKSAKRSLRLDSNVDRSGPKRTVLIVGGGPASLVCAETLRKRGFPGNITIVCSESHLPYDRAKLSKAPDSEPHSLMLRPDKQYYTDICVDILLNTEAVSINKDTKTVTVRSGDGSTKDLSYDSVFVATGGKPRTLKPMDGWNCTNIHVLRTVDEANEMTKACQGRTVVLVGSSFIAMEIAAFLAKKKACESVSVICGARSKVPFQSSLGPEIGALIMKMHEDKGVQFRTGVGIAGLIFDKSTNVVTQLKLTDNSLVEADVVILGIGVTPNTEILKACGVEADDRGFIVVDGDMRTSIEHIYAGGDIVSFPMQMAGGRSSNIQHWQMAHKHGEIAAKSIACNTKTGYGANYENIIIRGVDKSGGIIHEKEALEQKKFAAFYVAKDNVVAVATMMADPIAARFAQYLKNQGTFRVADIDKFLRNEIDLEQKGNCVVS